MIGLRVWTIAFGAIGGHRKTAVFPHARERRDDHRANLRQLARDERRRERLPEKDRDVEPIVDETAPLPSLNQFRRPPGMAIEAACRERRREQNLSMFTRKRPRTAVDAQAHRQQRIADANQLKRDGVLTIFGL